MVACVLCEKWRINRPLSMRRKMRWREFRSTECVWNILPIAKFEMPQCVLTHITRPASRSCPRVMPGAYCALSCNAERVGATGLYGRVQSRMAIEPFRQSDVCLMPLLSRGLPA